MRLNSRDDLPRFEKEAWCLEQATKKNILSPFLLDIGLVHGDLSLMNVIVDTNTVILIDWGTAESHIVPHMEIIGILQNNLQEEDALFHSFLRGYGMSTEEFRDIKPDIESLAILQSTDKLRWAIEKKPDKIKEFSEKLQKLLKP